MSDIEDTGERRRLTDASHPAKRQGCGLAMSIVVSLLIGVILLCCSGCSKRAPDDPVAYAGRNYRTIAVLYWWRNV